MKLRFVGHLHSELELVGRKLPGLSQVTFYAARGGLQVSALYLEQTAVNASQWDRHAEHRVEGLPFGTDDALEHSATLDGLGLVHYRGDEAGFVALGPWLLVAATSRQNNGPERDGSRRSQSSPPAQPLIDETIPVAGCHDALPPRIPPLGHAIVDA